MKHVYKHISIWSLSLLLMSCSYSKKQTNDKQEDDSLRSIGLVVLDPGHFHASLLQKNPLTSVDDTVRVYAPEGAELQQYLDAVNSYNQRTENPTSWKEVVYTGSDYLSKMLADGKGDVVLLAGNNQKKTSYILESIKAGYNVLSDKPLAISKQDFDLLIKAYQLAKDKGLLLYDLMTERYDILNRIEKELLHSPELFGELQKGTATHPSVTMESVHHFFKTVSGKPLARPAWYYDVEQQGEGIADVTTHLIDLVNWQCFPEKEIHYQTDVKVLGSTHWATPITLTEFKQSTQADAFPPYLNKYIKNNVLQVLANGTLNYSVKDINIGMKVTWNFTPPANGGDTFTSVKQGTKATLKIVQNKETAFTKQLYIEKTAATDATTFDEQLQKTIEKLQMIYPFLSLKQKSEGLYLIDIPEENRLGHEAHFSKVAETFLHYLRSKDMPEWENENTISKYYITTTAVDMAKDGIK